MSVPPKKKHESIGTKPTIVVFVSSVANSSS